MLVRKGCGGPAGSSEDRIRVRVRLKMVYLRILGKTN